MQGIQSTDYESQQLRAVTGRAIRPGGVELTARAVDFCSFPEGARLLDAGCGEGATVGFLRESYRLNVSGVDISSRLLKDGKSRDVSLPLALAKAECLPYGNRFLDGILCECVLSLLPEPQQALREFHRVLVPNGKLILSDMYLRGDETGDGLGEEALDGCLKGAVSHPTTKTMLEKTGFSILLFEDHTRLLNELAARLILAGYHSECLRGEEKTVGCSDQRQISAAVGRPGYYLLVARKV